MPAVTIVPVTGPIAACVAAAIALAAVWTGSATSSSLTVAQNAPGIEPGTRRTRLRRRSANTTFRVLRNAAGATAASLAWRTPERRRGTCRPIQIAKTVQLWRVAKSRQRLLPDSRPRSLNGLERFATNWMWWRRLARPELVARRLLHVNELQRGVFRVRGWGCRWRQRSGGSLSLDPSHPIDRLRRATEPQRPA